MNCGFDTQYGQLCTTHYGTGENFSCNCVITYNIGPGRSPVSSSGSSSQACRNKQRGQYQKTKSTAVNTLSVENVPTKPYEERGHVHCEDLNEFIWDSVTGTTIGYCITHRARPVKTVLLAHTHPFFDPNTFEEDKIKRACCLPLAGNACWDVSNAPYRRILNTQNVNCSDDDIISARNYNILMRVLNGKRFKKCP